MTVVTIRIDAGTVQDHLFTLRLSVPILHLLQLIGLALGIDPKELRVDRHVVSTSKVLAKLTAAPVRA